MKNFSNKFPAGPHGKASIQYVESAKAALRGANVCFIFTEWEEIRMLKPAEFKELMRTPLVYDGRNIYNVQEMEKAGVEYHSIGRNGK